jgi:peptide/nickel transport system permease protein
MAIYPGLMIFAVVIALNVLGDALRDALDPRGSGR